MVSPEQEPPEGSGRENSSTSESQQPEQRANTKRQLPGPPASQGSRSSRLTEDGGDSSGGRSNPPNPQQDIGPIFLVLMGGKGTVMLV